jgi:LPXTG-site transpeptidase (sortase) family protein
VTRLRLAAAALVPLAALALLGGCAPIQDPQSVEVGGTKVADDPIIALQPAALDREVAVYNGPDLPVPEPLPEDPYAPEPDVRVSNISIPAIGIDEPLHVGMTLTAINRGPSMWPGTALPGEVGNTVIAGHRTTYGAPFGNLDQLAEGDEVVFNDENGEHTYAVEALEIVDPTAVDIASQSNEYTATLFACHPPGSARQRIVVHLQLLRGNGQPMEPAK